MGFVSCIFVGRVGFEEDVERAEAAGSLKISFNSCVGMGLHEEWARWIACTRSVFGWKSEIFARIDDVVSASAAARPQSVGGRERKGSGATPCDRRSLANLYPRVSAVQLN